MPREQSRTITITPREWLAINRLAGRGWRSFGELGELVVDMREEKSYIADIEEKWYEAGKEHKHMETSDESPRPDDHLEILAPLKIGQLELFLEHFNFVGIRSSDTQLDIILSEPETLIESILHIRFGSAEGILHPPELALTRMVEETIPIEY